MGQRYIGNTPFVPARISESSSRKTLELAETELHSQMGPSLAGGGAAIDRTIARWIAITVCGVVDQRPKYTDTGGGASALCQVVGVAWYVDAKGKHGTNGCFLIWAVRDMGTACKQAFSKPYRHSHGGFSCKWKRNYGHRHKRTCLYVCKTRIREKGHQQNHSMNGLGH